MIELLHCDCMEYMATVPDKYFDLSIVDPPYGIHEKLKAGSSCQNKGNKFALMYEQKNWDMHRPTQDYFNELFRISKNQIIWGGNYFTDKLPVSRGWICWDKGGDNMTSVNNELAWSSYEKAMKMFRRCHGLDKGFMNKEGSNIHPTQKPVALYEWLLTNYAKKGQRVFDSHLGSASSAIAAHYFGVDFVGTELDKDYFEAAKARFDMATKQLAMSI